MIRIKIRSLARRTFTARWPEGIHTGYQLHQQCGGTEVISPSVINQIWQSDSEEGEWEQLKMIGIATIDLICQSLTTDLHSPVQLSDWIEFVPARGARATHNGAHRAGKKAVKKARPRK